MDTENLFWMTIIIVILKEIAHYYIDLKQHLEGIIMKNTTYLSPSSQNKMIEELGKRTVKTNLIEDAKNAGFIRFQLTILLRTTMKPEKLI